MPDTPASPLAAYIAFLERGELGYQFSPSANAAVFYPRVIAPRHRRGGPGMARQQGARHGLRHHRGAPAEGRPYNVALIDIDEGFRMMSRVEDIAPTAVKIGMRVKFRVHRAEGDEPPYPVFTPAEGA